MSEVVLEKVSVILMALVLVWQSWVWALDFLSAWQWSALMSEVVLEPVSVILMAVVLVGQSWVRGLDFL
jgi:hypothetical protein